MDTVDLARAVWRKSTRSGSTGGDCVEVATFSQAVAVRDSKDQAGPLLVFGASSWRTFLTGLQHTVPTNR